MYCLLSVVGLSTRYLLKEELGLTSKRQMEAEVWLDCMISVRAHMC